MKNENMKRQVLKSILLLMLLNAVPGWAQQQDLADFKETERPWLWWYWLGSALIKKE